MRWLNNGMRQIGQSPSSGYLERTILCSDWSREPEDHKEPRDILESYITEARRNLRDHRISQTVASTELLQGYGRTVFPGSPSYNLCFI